MKKIICVCILVILVFLLSGCMTKEVTLPNGERKKAKPGTKTKKKSRIK